MSTEIDDAHPEMAVNRASEAFRDGSPVLIHDFDEREGETDIVYPAEVVTPDDVARLRNDAGGLICVAIPHDVATELELPFARDVVDHPVANSTELHYDDRSSFSITINHRDTYTGITDKDRSLTIQKLARTADNPRLPEFAETFRTPGHVPILRAAQNLLANRQGHTELGLALAIEANVTPAVVVCEMLDGHTGNSISKIEAKRYARRHNLPFICGEQILRSIS